MMGYRPLSASPRTLPYIAAIGAGGVFLFVFLKNAWLCDDFWIGARQVEQLYEGNGLRWNPHERIHLFTSVIGFFLTALARLFTADYFINFGAQAVAFNALVLGLLAVLLKTPAKWTAAVLLLLASNSYMDFSWAGVHNPVGHAMLVGYVICWERLWQAIGQDRRAASRALLALAVLAGFAPLFRHDFALIVWPPLFYALWATRRECSGHVLVGAVVALLLPLTAWTLFSLLYFGFPFPTTAYIKLGAGFSRWTWIQSGLFYYRFTLLNDPLVMLLVFGMVVWLVSRRGPSRALASAAVLHLFYVLYTGADYMGGRFFTYPYLLAVIVVVSQWEEITATLWPQRSMRDNARRRKGKRRGEELLSAPPPPPAWWRGAAAPAALGLLWTLAFPHTPLKSPFTYHTSNPEQAGGISDERAAYHKGSSLADYVAFARGKVEIYPNHPSVRLGKIVARANVPVIHMCDMGMMPFTARTDQTFIDIYGYSDVLQSRLPGLNPRPSHVIRRLPPGYLESVAEDDARIRNQPLNRYYEQLRLVTQSDHLFTAARLRAIVAVNWQTPPTGYLASLPASGQFRLPILCYAKHDPAVLAHLRDNIEHITAGELNRSSLSFSEGRKNHPGR